VILPDSAVHRLRGVLATPEVPGGRYQIGPVLGQGGMGTVYRAHDRALDRAVALKVLRPDIGEQEAAGRFGREARILARLDHPGVVPVHDLGTLADGRVFYVMKLVQGRPLGEELRGAPLADALRLFLRVCETVSFAHVRGVVHRDLKPSNIMVGAFGEVLVLDWGIARLLPSAVRDEVGVESSSPDDGMHPWPLAAPGAEPRTDPGTVLGTPGFMAPEQAEGRTDATGPAADVFSLGAILREIVTLGAPSGQSPRPVASIWMKAMEARPEERYGTAAELAGEVARFLDRQPVLAHRESMVERLGRSFHRYKTPIVLVLTYLSIRLLFLLIRGL
jgi:serine/threonine protein kinase